MAITNRAWGTFLAVMYFFIFVTAAVAEDLDEEFEEPTPTPAKPVVAPPVPSPTQPPPTAAMAARLNRSRQNHQLFHPEDYRYLIGFESSSASLGVLGNQAIVLGSWMDKFGWELLLGYTKNEDNATSSVAEANNLLANSGTTTTTTSGSRNPHTISLGTVLKTKLYQNHWLQIYAGGFVGVNYYFSTDYPTGSKVATFTDLSDKSNSSVTETSWGTVQVKRGLQVALGPKVGAEFYMKWIPHLALGFSTGLATYIGGKTTTTTTVRTRTYTTVAGEEQPATADSQNTTTAELDPGIRGVTFGIGGSTFQITGVFTLRYVW